MLMPYNIPPVLLAQACLAEALRLMASSTFRPIFGQQREVPQVPPRTHLTPPACRDFFDSSRNSIGAQCRGCSAPSLYGGKQL